MASPATHRGAPSQHLAGTLPGRAWHQIRTYPETWLEPYLDVHPSYPCLAASLNPSYSWLEPDLDVHPSYPCLAASLNPSYSWLEPDLDVAGT